MTAERIAFSLAFMLALKGESPYKLKSRPPHQVSICFSSLQKELKENEWLSFEYQELKREICEQPNLIAHNQAAIAALDNVQV